MRKFVFVALTVLVILAVVNESLAISNPCQYCKYCNFCKDCDRCPCDWQVCKYCPYCKYCTLCSYCDTICAEGGVVDTISSWATYLTGFGAADTDASKVDLSEVDSDIKSDAEDTERRREMTTKFLRNRAQKKAAAEAANPAEPAPAQAPTGEVEL
ncbi:sarcoplasmic reticulum histidine-rich calcium-binding protein [Pelomyxa schiedti]|nr:sarcoplasmic reticulum histidine-rich calcium-binding protein [Pelomyxa schiedti]